VISTDGPHRSIDLGRSVSLCRSAGYRFLSWTTTSLFSGAQPRQQSTVAHASVLRARLGGLRLLEIWLSLLLLYKSSLSIGAGAFSKSFGKNSSLCILLMAPWSWQPCPTRCANTASQELQHLELVLMRRCEQILDHCDDALLFFLHGCQRVGVHEVDQRIFEHLGFHGSMAPISTRRPTIRRTGRRQGRAKDGAPAKAPWRHD
jgi:hypothetical protein